MYSQYQISPNLPNDWDFEEDIADATEEYLRLPITTEAELTSVEEVTMKLLALLTRKTSESDGIAYVVLPRLPDRRISFLIELFNACVRLSYFHFNSYGGSNIDPQYCLARTPNKAETSDPYAFYHRHQKSLNALYTGAYETTS